MSSEILSIITGLLVSMAVVVMALVVILSMTTMRKVWLWCNVFYRVLEVSIRLRCIAAMGDGIG